MSCAGRRFPLFADLSTSRARRLGSKEGRLCRPKKAAPAAGPPGRCTERGSSRTRVRLKAVSGRESEQDFDLTAAGLRADGGELRISLEALAHKLEESLPAHTRVDRRGGGLLRRGDERVRGLHVELGGSRYELAVAGERVSCFRELEVAGITIKREELDPAAWIGALTGELREEAERSAQARDALAKLLD